MDMDAKERTGTGVGAGMGWERAWVWTWARRGHDLGHGRANGLGHRGIVSTGDDKRHRLRLPNRRQHPNQRRPEPHPPSTSSMRRYSLPRPNPYPYLCSSSDSPPLSATASFIRRNLFSIPELESDVTVAMAGAFVVARSAQAENVPLSRRPSFLCDNFYAG